MRVALLGAYPDDPSRVVGGVEAVTVALARHLGGMDDLELHVVTGRPGLQAYQRVRQGRILVHRVPEYRLDRLALFRRDVAALRVVLYAIRPGVVHAHGSTTYTEAATGYRGAPHVVTVHGVIIREALIQAPPAERLRRVFDAAYERYNLRRARNIIVISPYLLDEMPWLRRARTWAIENPADDLFFALWPVPEPGRLLCPARVIPRKGILQLLQAFRPLPAAFPAAQLRIAGELGVVPDYEAQCRRYVAKHGLEGHVHFLGSLSQSDLAVEYARAAVVVLPSSQETAPVAVEEAMAAARPVVATRVGGVPYMIEHGVTGLLLDWGDVDGLTHALYQLLSDPNQAEALGRAARQAAEDRFRATGIAVRTRAVYEELNRSCVLH
ncbi:MAG TPA: glycosyltransferase family 1 protein [Anaerolineae bacterium]|nr:glycosyltransferase family 1 protein [Anaerolineae bacterium]